MSEQEQGLTYQQTVRGTVFKHDHATQGDVDFDHEEIIVLELWEICCCYVVCSQVESLSYVQYTLPSIGVSCCDVVI